MLHSPCIVRGILRQYDANAGAARVEIVAGPSALLEGVPVVQPAANDALVAGAEVALLLWPDVGGVVLGPYRVAAPKAVARRRHVVRSCGTTAWITLFARQGTAARSGALVEALTAYGAPSTAVGRVLAVARDDATVSIVAAQGDAAQGTDAVAFRWDDDRLQVRATEADVALLISCLLFNPDPSAPWDVEWE